MPPKDLLAAFGLRAPQFIAQTPIASVWKVRRGTHWAALKVYTDQDMRNEEVGFTYLAALDGRNAARIYETAPGAAVLEWLEGPSLGDLSRAGRDAEASRELGHLALRLHTTGHLIPESLHRLEDWFAALFALRLAPECDPLLRQNIKRCQLVAQGLLGSQTDIRPLHGDLHHDNVRLGARGYCAFDAKGVLGERAYELANAFRNPKGAEALVRNPARVWRLSSEWAQIFAVRPARLLAWAAAKSALSIAWRSGPVLVGDTEADVLAVLLEVMDRASAP